MIAAQKLNVESLENEREEHVRALETQHLVRLTQERQVVAAIPPTTGTRGTKQPRGRKGYEQLSDYLLPVLQLVLRSGIRHTEAFRRVAEKLDVEYSTAAAQCTIRLRLTTEQFVELVKSKKIKALLKERFPHRVDEIDREL